MQSKGQIYIYYNYAPDGSKIVVLSYVDDFSTGIQMKILEIGLLTPWDIDSM